MDAIGVWVCSKDAKIREKIRAGSAAGGCAAAQRDSLTDIDEVLSGGAAKGIVVIDKDAIGPVLPVSMSKAHSPDILFVLVVRPYDYTSQELAVLLDSGVDDFIPADIDERVLSAKIGAYLRRLRGGRDEERRSVITSPRGLFQADTGALAVFIKDKTSYRRLRGFTPTEFRIAAFLIRNCARVVDRRTLMENIWGEKASGINSENVDKHVESIRRKLGESGNRLKTVYGVGYILNE